MNKLPDELADLTTLLRLDISHNLFLNLPSVVFKMPKLRQLKANNNAIIGKCIFFEIKTHSHTNPNTVFHFVNSQTLKMSKWLHPIHWNMLTYEEIHWHRKHMKRWKMPPSPSTLNYLNEWKKNGKILPFKCNLANQQQQQWKENQRLIYII